MTRETRRALMLVTLRLLEAKRERQRKGAEKKERERSKSR